MPRSTNPAVTRRPCAPGQSCTAAEPCGEHEAAIALEDWQFRELMESTREDETEFGDRLWNAARIALGGGYVRMLGGGPEVCDPEERARAHAFCLSVWNSRASDPEPR